MLRILKSEHGEIEALLGEALGYLATADDIEPRALGDYRQRFDRWIKRHLEFLGGTVAPALRVEGSEAALSLERRLRAETLELWDVYAAHAGNFPMATAKHNWTAYRASGDEVIERVLALIRLARGDLYPLLEELDIDRLGLPAKRAHARRRAAG